MIIFGSLMYFAEQGTWNPDTQAWEREGDNGIEKNPFDSIPACFWWAVVTATTVGYGDIFTPKTNPGKAVAGVTMVWSVCVLALPIGVIGGNFIDVWAEYDEEKEKDMMNKIKEKQMLAKSLAWGDPLHYSRHLVIEVWHDSGIRTVGNFGEVIQSEFLGEVEVTLTLSPDGSSRELCERVPLVGNPDKSSRLVRHGQVTFEYRWEPHPRNDDSSDKSTLLKGILEIQVIKADNLIGVDWGGSNPFCVVVAHPHGPDEDGELDEVARRSHKLMNTTSPEWNAKFIFEMNWIDRATRGSQIRIGRRPSLAKGALRTSTVSTGSLNSTPGSPNSPGRALTRKCFEGPLLRVVTPKRVGDDEVESQEDLPMPMPIVVQKKEDKGASKDQVLEKHIPSLQAEVEELRRAVPELKAEINEVARNLTAILGCLRIGSKEINDPKDDVPLPPEACPDPPSSQEMHTLLESLQEADT
jgi:hypothetical protein